MKEEERRVAEAVDNAIKEILKLIKLLEGEYYLKPCDLEDMLEDLRTNLRSDPVLYRRLVLEHIGES